MNRKQILRGTGALTLIIVGALAGRATSPKASVAKLYYSNGAGATNCHALASAITPVNSTILTTGAATVQAKLSTSVSGIQHKLFSTANCTSASAVHFNG